MQLGIEIVFQHLLQCLLRGLGLENDTRLVRSERELTTLAGSAGSTLNLCIAAATACALSRRLEYMASRYEILVS